MSALGGKRGRGVKALPENAWVQAELSEARIKRNIDFLRKSPADQRILKIVYLLHDVDIKPETGAWDLLSEWTIAEEELYQSENDFSALTEEYFKQSFVIAWRMHRAYANTFPHITKDIFHHLCQLYTYWWYQQNHISEYTEKVGLHVFQQAQKKTGGITKTDSIVRDGRLTFFDQVDIALYATLYPDFNALESLLTEAAAYSLLAAAAYLDDENAAFAFADTHKRAFVEHIQKRTGKQEPFAQSAVDDTIIAKEVFRLYKDHFQS